MLLDNTVPNEALITEMKEMVTRQLEEFLVKVESNNLAFPSTKQPHFLSFADQQDALAMANQRIDDFLAQGAITENEMWRIEQDLVKLDFNNRVDILHKLSKAVNSGRIKTSK